MTHRFRPARRRVLAALAAAPLAAGLRDAAATAPAAAAGATLPAARIAAAIAPDAARRILALDAERLDAADVAGTLALAPAPRVIALSGSVAFVTMRPFAEFLVAMGYPDAQLRQPGDGGYSYSSYTDSATLAGEIAWHYEREGLLPLLVGHSQGGMLAVKTLHELAGAFATEVAVRDPVAGRTLARTTIVDPVTGATRAVVGLRLPYATALATGKLFRVLLGQWNMLARLRSIPDSVVEFTGFSIPNDPIAGNLFGDEPYRAEGRAQVRNVTLPASYSHIGLPLARHLADQPPTRAWIDAWRPGSTTPLPDAPDLDTRNLVHAAEIWFALKKHWCLQAQALLSAAPRAS